jgi:hypothetical protein
MEYAKTLIKHRAHSTDTIDDPAADEESWTFIGDEADPELARRIAEWEPMANLGLAGVKGAVGRGRGGGGGGRGGGGGVESDLGA